LGEICGREIEQCNERENSLTVQWGFSRRRTNSAKKRTEVKFRAFEDAEKRLAPVGIETISIESKNYYCKRIRAADKTMMEELERAQDARLTLLLAPDNAEAKETYKDAQN
jgi:hypothetical protein